MRITSSEMLNSKFHKNLAWSGLAKIKIRGDDGATSTRAELHIDRTSDARGAGIRIESSTGTLSQWFYRFSLQWRFII